MAQPSDADRRHLALYRAAARQVRDASPISLAQRVHMEGHRTADGRFDMSHSLLDGEAFRSLAMSVRLVYQSNEPANFGHVCRILSRSAPSGTATAVAAVRAQYNKALDKHHPILKALALRDKAAYSPRDLLETWLYSEAFHQDESRLADYAALRQLGDNFLFMVQGIVLSLAGRILDLDDLVADFLSEPRLPRIESGPSAAQPTSADV